MERLPLLALELTSWVCSLSVIPIDIVAFAEPVQYACSLVALPCLWLMKSVATIFNFEFLIKVWVNCSLTAAIDELAPNSDV